MILIMLANQHLPASCSNRRFPAPAAGADPEPLTLGEIVAALRQGTGRKPGLVAIPPALLRFALAVLGRGANWEQINGALVVDPRKLLTAGWQADADTAGALAQMTRSRTSS
jgi:hypothetical protein